MQVACTSSQFGDYSDVFMVVCPDIGEGLLPENALVLRASMDIHVRCGSTTQGSKCECSESTVQPLDMAQQCAQVRCYRELAHQTPHTHSCAHLTIYVVRMLFEDVGGAHGANGVSLYACAFHCI